MDSVMSPFPVGFVPWVTLINAELAARLNADEASRGLWQIDSNQLGLSQPGSYRLNWSLRGGRVEKASRGQQGTEAVAPMLAIRHMRVRCEIRSDNPDSVGITGDDVNLAEQVQRAIIQVVNAQRVADWGDASEDWGDFTSDVAQHQVIMGFEFDTQLNVLDDPYLFKQINSIENTQVLVTT